MGNVYERAGATVSFVVRPPRVLSRVLARRTGLLAGLDVSSRTCISLPSLLSEGRVTVGPEGEADKTADGQALATKERRTPHLPSGTERSLEGSWRKRNRSRKRKLGT
ncbi:hypothetical protein Y1Q_0023705 [Alligator mississippiensis]|uniref:Uncharacterized protein n=1 Tax=Alligator mississippiensis TaxID=8496 RepID=A0A151M7N5_ALLMI|nr:hypothetical protein Y1Q_0023705 [Alligator mississippiensis]